MKVRQIFRLFFLAGLCLTGVIACAAQGADGRTPIHPDKEDVRDRPKSMLETLERLRIQKEKKEYDKMIGRGEEALKISAELETSFAASGRLTEKEVSKIAAVEKIVRLIRGDLGGDDDDERSAVQEGKSLSLADAVKSLRSTTVALFDELKKTSRFTISAAAIHTSNVVLRLARFLRIKN